MSLNPISRLLQRRFRGQQVPTDRSFATALSGTRQQLARFSENAHPSPIFREQCLLRLASISGQLGELLKGRLVFHSTETWRTVYEAVLNSCETRRYLSVAVIRSDDYWRDRPGESSLEFNYRLIDHGFTVHRVFIVDEYFWPPAARLPSRDLLNWIVAQSQRGIEVGLVRLGELESEEHLIVDMGIYGREAVGTQQTDLQGRTTRFELSFHPEQVRALTTPSESGTPTSSRSPILEIERPTGVPHRTGGQIGGQLRSAPVGCLCSSVTSTGGSNGRLVCASCARGSFPPR